MVRKTLYRLFILGAVGLLIWIWFVKSDTTSHLPVNAATKNVKVLSDQPLIIPKRIVFINSYHQGYPWSDGILSGFVQTLNMKKRQQSNFWGNEDYVLRTFYMDTKRNSGEANKRSSAKQAMELIESWKPDIVITSDDNAVKYLVTPMLKHSALPIVFSGVNWDASEYNLPQDQVTGMIEVQPVDQIIAALQPYARGKKIGFLKGKDLSAVKEAEAFETFLGISLHRRLVNNFEEWITAYRAMQQDCDILLVGNSASIRGWDHTRAKELVATATRIPSGTWDAWMQEYALLTFSTIPAEQGAWVAEAARTILTGQSPANIAVTQNHKTKIYRNMVIAKQLKIIFPMEFIRRSLAVEQGVHE
jgi:ABC-type uncharacterized transport system substrate-binding protein